MSKQFNIGDDVIVVNDREVWLDYHDLPNDTILSVVEKHDNEYHYVDGDKLLIEIEAVSRFPEDFQVVSKPKENAATLLNAQRTIGAIGYTPETIIPMTSVEKEETVRADGGTVIGKLNLPSGLSDETYKQFGEMLVKAHESKDSQILGVYRPELETRKVGKVPMHMVIDGFPRALREVAKVMGWAADVKGYKLHDWKNLPDADIEFPSAGNRHMIDNSIMKSEGTSAIERVDHESNLVHLAHEVFNKLAELELILTGKIK